MNRQMEMCPALVVVERKYYHKEQGFLITKGNLNLFVINKLCQILFLLQWQNNNETNTHMHRKQTNKQTKTNKQKKQQKNRKRMFLISNNFLKLFKQ